MIDRRRNVRRFDGNTFDGETFQYWYSYGEINSPKRSRFLVLEKNGVYLAVDILLCGMWNGFITPTTWREYDNLDTAIGTTIIRGAGF